uniref:Retrovirus-related Pol polyprotein from transposon TNT 1-94 n=1 Tax=Cajanus cajan TaxID=3821 RepID=A0A151TDF1_CAJCA|nr:Retrovirus-related Pol polyprotein from transposon TNT 1-94 [Cajanus cajan]
MTMDEEVKSIERNQTWKLVELPIRKKNIGVKWVYKTKLNELGKINKYKARLVIKGYLQQHRVNYKEVFAPIARMDIVKMIKAIVSNKGWKLYQLDVKYAFLHGVSSEEVYVE